MKEKKLKRAKLLFNALCAAVPCTMCFGMSLISVVLNNLAVFSNEGLAFIAIVILGIITVVATVTVNDITDDSIKRLRKYIDYKERK